MHLRVLTLLEFGRTEALGIGLCLLEAFGGDEPRARGWRFSAFLSASSELSSAPQEQPMLLPSLGWSLGAYCLAGCGEGLS